MGQIRGKRRPQDFDPNKSDPEDETYGATTSKPTRSSRSRKAARPPRKRQRHKYSGDSDDDDDDDESLDDESEINDDDFSVSEEPEEQELGPSGRPVRRAAPSRPLRDKSGSEESELGRSEDEKEQNEGKQQENKEATRPSRRSSKKISLVIKLRGTPHQFPPIPSATTKSKKRARSSSASVQRVSRRSSRIAHDESEGMYALTNSGNHVEVVRQATSSPPPAGKRPSMGGKGLKKPSTSVVYEDSQESRREVAPSREDLGEERSIEDQIAAAAAEANQDDNEGQDLTVPDSGEDKNEGEDDEDDEEPVNTVRRSTRRRDSQKEILSGEDAVTRREGLRAKKPESVLGKRKARSSQRTQRESSDFEPGDEDVGDEELSASDSSTHSPTKGAGQTGDESSPGRSNKRRKTTQRGRQQSIGDDSDLDADELAEEVGDLKESSRRSRRPKSDIIYEGPRKPRRQVQRPDYRIINPEIAFPIDEDDAAPTQATPSKRARGGASTYQRSLFSTYGPFGGAGGPPPVLGGPGGLGAAAGADSDSSDDEIKQRPRLPGQGLGGLVGMTPTTAGPPNLGLYSAPVAQVHGNDPNQTPANLGKIKDKQALADADPLGVDQNVNFDAVGGLEGHIDQLKEMVALPLLYPEIFQRFHVVPPRGVLFHGPPGTGKTLLARALASSVSSQGKKVTFYMRKGADALSKWVGEAEKQLRLLFEEARKNQPSIIFFDEIDGKKPLPIKE